MSKIADEPLRASEECLRLFVEEVREYAIFQLDPLGYVISWNSGAERLKGYTAKEIIGKHFSVFYPEEQAKSGKPERMLAEAVRHGHSDDEGWRIRKDGSRFWASVVVTKVCDSSGTLRGFAKITRDMTERRRAEQALKKAKKRLEVRAERRAALLARANQELRAEIAERERVERKLEASRDQLRALAARLQSVREEERTLIAREIHDELGQACTAIKMDLALISGKTTKGQTELRARVDAAMRLVNDMVASVRRVASELRPRALDELGLTAALEWQAKDFEGRTGISCAVTLPQQPVAIDEERSTAIFRIFQESLTNVARHAQATRVEIRLAREADQLVFEVHDNGKGFNPDDSDRSLGLLGMQERALMLNGEIQIEGVPGAGTKMTVRIPLPHSRPPEQDSA